MIIANHKIFTVLTFLALLASQLLPNFAYYNLTLGRWVPHTIAFLIGVVALCFMINYKAKKEWIYATIVLMIISVIYLILQAIFISGGIKGSDVGNIYRFVTVYLFFLMGYFFFRLPEDFEHFFMILLAMAWFNVFLAFDFYVNGLSALQKLYIHRLMEFRFSGTYGWPYNNALFLFMALTSTVAIYFIRHTKAAKTISILTGIIMIILLFSSGSRSVLLALALIIIVLTLYMMTVLSRKKIAYKITALLLIVIGIVVVIITNFSDLFPQVQRLLDFENVTLNRDVQISKTSDLLFENVLSSLFGMGSSAVDAFYVESGFNYLFRFGIIGTLFVLLPLVILFLFRSLGELLCFARFNLNNKKTKGLLLINLFVFANILFSLLMLTSTNAHTHFRYIFVLYFMLGMYAKFLNVNSVWRR